LKIIFINIYIYNFSKNIFIEKGSQSCGLETVSLSKRLLLLDRREYITFNKYLYRKKSNLCFGVRVAVLNDFFYQTGVSTSFFREVTMHWCSDSRMTSQIRLSNKKILVLKIRLSEENGGNNWYSGAYVYSMTHLLSRLPVPMEFDEDKGNIYGTLLFSLFTTWAKFNTMKLSMKPHWETGMIYIETVYYNNNDIYASCVWKYKVRLQGRTWHIDIHKLIIRETWHWKGG
jgi:hypothetical protein